MIIFDLDGTLADCEHRRHFVDPLAPRPGGEDYQLSRYSPELNIEYFHKYGNGKAGFFYRDTHKRWQPDWKSFYEACDNDEPILPTLGILNRLLYTEKKVEIWSGRSECVREKTEKWLVKNSIFSSKYSFEIKMRPIGDTTPDDEMKERWLRERCNHISLDLTTGKETWNGHGIDFVFDDRPKVIRMWRRRGIFVFNCCQHDEEF